jgi:hypothetical protein
VVLGVCGVKTGRRMRFEYFGGGEIETTDLGSGMGVHSSVIPTFTVLEHMCWCFTYACKT